MLPLLLVLVVVVAVMGMNGKKKGPGQKTVVLSEKESIASVRERIPEYMMKSDLAVCRDFYEAKLEREGIRGFSVAISGNDYDNIYENYLVRWRSFGRTGSPAAAPGFPGGCPESLIRPPADSAVTSFARSSTGILVPVATPARADRGRKITYT